MYCDNTIRNSGAIGEHVQSGSVLVVKTHRVPLHLSNYTVSETVMCEPGSRQKYGDLGYFKDVIGHSNGRPNSLVHCPKILHYYTVLDCPSGACALFCAFKD